MSHIVTRKGPIGDESKKHSDSPVKEMKKKMAANAEKEKQAAEKDKNTEKTNVNDKQIEKSTQNDKQEKKEKSTDKVVVVVLDKADKKDKSTDKIVDKTEKKDKPSDKVVEKTDKKDKSADKVIEKTVEKKTEKPEKKDKAVDKSSDKKEKPAEKKEVAPVEKAKEDTKENGKSETADKQKKETPKAKQNGARVNGEPADTVSSEEEDDQMFPELAYEDSDVEYFEPPTPEGPSRSYTRRSQSKDSKLLKLKDDLPTDRKLRSSDSPKPQDKSEEDKGKEDSAKDKLEESRSDDKSEVGVTIEVENEEEARKPDTNYSKSRVKVSPYRRSGRLADQTQTSLLANYTGNNTTMEMDITESSLMLEEPSNVESPYLSGLRSIRGRRSYKPLKEMTLRNIGVNTSIQSTTSVTDTSARPTGTVVGRKRKPESTPSGDDTHPDALDTRTKRAKLLERLGGLARPFRFTSAASERLCVESAAEIVGINTDLPLTAPVAAAGSFDPETIKHSTPLPARPAPAHAPGPAHAHRDKRCSIM